MLDRSLTVTPEHESGKWMVRRSTLSHIERVSVSNLGNALILESVRVRRSYVEDPIQLTYLIAINRQRTQGNRTELLGGSICNDGGVLGMLSLFCVMK